MLGSFFASSWARITSGISARSGCRSSRLNLMLPLKSSVFEPSPPHVTSKMLPHSGVIW